MPSPAHEGWAAGLLVSVTGAPKELRTTLQELVESAGGRYSPNLSRRCTHLTVYGQQGSARAAQSRSGHCSEKLCTAVRNRAKWGLCIVDIDWLVQSARAGKRLDEAAFPATLPPLPLPLSGAKEQAAPQTVGNGPAGSSSVASSWSSLQAADTHACHSGRQHGPFVATTAGSAGKQAQRAAAQPLQQSVNSRPLTSFGQLSRSLRTQLPSVDRSMCLQGPAATEQTAGRTDSVARGGAPWGVQSAAVAGGPPELQTRFGHEDSESGGGIDFARLPMTQAGFIPGSELLAQLQLLAPAADAVPTRGNTSPQQPKQQPSQQLMQTEPRRAQAAAHSAATVEAVALLPLPKGGQGPLASPTRGEHPPPDVAQAGMPACRPQSAATTRELFNRLQLSATADPMQQAGCQQPARVSPTPGLSTAELLEQLRASASPAPLPAQPQRQTLPSMATVKALEQLRAVASAATDSQWRVQENGREPGLSTEALLKQLQAPAGLSAPAQQQQQQQPAEAQPGSGLSTAELLEQLRASCSGAPQAQQREHLHCATGASGPPTAQLLEQLRASSAAGTALQRSGPAGLHQAEHGSCRQQGPAGLCHPALSSAAQPAALAPASPGRQSAAATQESLQEGHAAAQTVSLLAQLRASRQLLGPAQPAAAVRSLQGEQHCCQRLLQHSADRQALSAAELLPRVQQDSGRGAISMAAGSGLTKGEDGAAELARLLAAAHGQRAAALAPPQASTRLAAGDQSVPPQLACLASLPSKYPGLHQVPPAAAALRQAHWAPNQPVPEVRQPQQQQQQKEWQRTGCSSVDPQLTPAKYRRQERGEPQPGAAASAQHEIAALPQTELMRAGSGALPAGSLPSSAGSVPAAGGQSAGCLPIAADASAAASEAPRLAQSEACSPGLEASGSQVTDSGGKVFSALLAVIDPSLDSEERERVTAALEKGGGCVAEGGSLGRGVTHVVCQPEDALKWLSMGVGIVSPQWVHQSLRTGRQQRCLTVSADASRHLPAAPGAAASSQLQSSQCERGGQGSSCQQQQGLGSELLLSREAREQMLSQLARTAVGAGAAQGSPASVAGAAVGAPQASTPAELLSSVLWSVLEPPHAARKEARRLQLMPTEEGAVIIPDSEGEEEDEWAGLCCASASQAAVQSVLLDAAASGSGGGGTGAQAAPAQGDPAAWQAEVVLSGVAQLTLLFPRDARGELGLDTRVIQLAPAVAPTAGHPGGLQQAGSGPVAHRQLTVGALLALVHGYYAEQLPSQEQLQLLQGFPGAAAAAAVLRPAFLELTPVARGALLGPRCSFEGLRKATREPAGAVYEVQLGQ